MTGRVEVGAMDSILPRKIEKLLQSIEVLVIDDNQYMRKVIRNLLTSIGVKNVHEAVDGVAGLEAIRAGAEPRHSRLGDAAAHRRRAGADRALARRVPGARHSHY